MIINRDKYLNQLIAKKNNNLIKVITGLRRSGKSFLVFNLFKEYLINNNVEEDHIITFAFDKIDDVIKLDDIDMTEDTLINTNNKYIKYVNSKKFYLYIKSLIKDDKTYYILLDEIQLLDNFVMVLNSFMNNDKLDVYVTGSNSKMLSKDILTEFRGRGDEIYISPLSFKEYYNYSNKSFDDAYLEYQYFGGMPYICSLNSESDKQEYLKRLFSEIYIKDIVEKNGIKNVDSFETLFKVLASSIGSYTNPKNIENSFKSVEKVNYGHDAIKKHIEYIIDSFILKEAIRYDIKGKKYIGANSKYYFTDIGLRNALINFRQDEPTHIMENIIYNELINRGYSVDVGVVEVNEKNNNGNYVRKQLEIDFVCNRLNDKIYIQSVYSIEDKIKLVQEIRSLNNIKDNFRKIIIVKDYIKSYFTEDGIEVISLRDFLLNEKL